MFKRSILRQCFCVVLAAAWLASAAACAQAERLLFFTGSWCAPCRQAKKDILADSEFLKQHEFEILDVKENPELVKEYNVRSVPTFILQTPDGGVELSRKVGYESLADLKSWIDAQR